eukprot:3162593-Prymnesium_polylepis.1
MERLLLRLRLAPQSHVLCGQAHAHLRRAHLRPHVAIGMRDSEARPEARLKHRMQRAMRTEPPRAH